MYGQHILSQTRSRGGKAVVYNIKEILNRLTNRQQNKLKDFLISEIDDDVLKETIDFILSDDHEKKEKFQNLLYTGKKYKGVFLEGNQYLISSNDKNVILIDALSEEHGVNEVNTRINIDIDYFIGLISNKKEVLDFLNSK